MLLLLSVAPACRVWGKESRQVKMPESSFVFKHEAGPAQGFPAVEPAAAIRWCTGSHPHFNEEGRSEKLVSHAHECVMCISTLTQLDAPVRSQELRVLAKMHEPKRAGRE